MRITNKWRVVSFLLVAVCTVVALLESCEAPNRKQETVQQDSLASAALFVGSSKCQSCHTKEFKDWEQSDHLRAMQHATDSTVVGDFNITTFTADGVTSRFYKRDGKFYIHTQGNDGQNHEYEVLYTFGFYPLQQYLIAFPGGRLQSTRVSWDAREKKWFNQYAGQQIHHKDWLHWTGASQNWNTMCASCHSTNLQKNYDFASDAFTTTWDEINVTCESCHGAGSKHIAFVNSEEHKEGVKMFNAGLAYGKNTNPQLQLNTCAPCHARKTDVTLSYIPGKEVLNNLIPQIINDEFYYGDGQIKEEDYEYSSFAQSKMFHNNVRCSNCHNPHSGKMLMVGNALCMSCHEPRYNSKEHHFHGLNSEGSSCVNCHMPEKTYMGNDHRRDHSFRIPRPDQSILYGTPNTCTSCHTKETNKWAAEAVNKWYGSKRSYHFSDDLLPGSLLTDKSEGHLLKLLKDTLQPEIARATAVFYLGSIQTQGSANALLLALNDRKALVRYHSLRALENFPPPVWLEVAYGRLSDPVRSVRIAAADLYHRIPPASLPAAARSPYASADAENKKFLHEQRDFALGNVMLADYQLQGGDHLNAIKHYVRGLQKDSLMNYARLNLASTYNAVGDNAKALKSLQEAARIDPANDRIFYNLGLLYYEMNQVANSLESFKQAVKLGSVEVNLYYNYGLLLQKQGKVKEAEQLFLKGFSLNPQALNINYALTSFYMNQGVPQKARKHATILRRMDPNNPEYQPIFRSLGL